MDELTNLDWSAPLVEQLALARIADALEVVAANISPTSRPAAQVNDVPPDHP